MTVTIPKALAALSPAEREELMRAGLYEAVQARIRQIKSEIAESKEHSHRFESKYGKSLEELSKELDSIETHKAHEDYNDWFFWNEVLHRNLKSLAELQENQDH